MRFLFFVILRASGSIDYITWGFFRSPNCRLGNAFTVYKQMAFVFYCIAPGFCSKQWTIQYKSETWVSTTKSCLLYLLIFRNTSEVTTA